MNNIKKLFFVGLFVALTTVATQAAHASEGTVELTNRVGDDARCWAGSILMQDQNYKILVSCRDIIYPGGTDIFNYVVWLNPLSGGNAQRLGTLNLGKVEFRTKVAFSSLFITKEKESSAKTPTGAVVMQGTLRPIALLERPQRTTNTNSGTQTQTPAPTETEQPVDDTIATPTPQPRTGVAKFLTSGILAILGLAGIIFVIFVVTRR